MTIKQLIFASTLHADLVFLILGDFMTECSVAFLQQNLGFYLSQLQWSDLALHIWLDNTIYLPFLQVCM